MSEFFQGVLIGYVAGVACALVAIIALSYLIS